MVDFFPERLYTGYGKGLSPLGCPQLTSPLFGAIMEIEREPAGKTAGPGNLNTTYEKVADSLAGRLLFHAFEQFYHQCDNDCKNHQHNGEHLKVTHKLPSFP